LHTSYYSLLSYFFFQAEDGIRDGHVTGVQTCALPIYPRDRVRRAVLLPSGAGSVQREAEGVRHHPGQAGASPATDPVPAARVDRSEERRVGKEWRSWWWVAD